MIHCNTNLKSWSIYVGFRDQPKSKSGLGWGNKGWVTIFERFNAGSEKLGTKQRVGPTFLFTLNMSNR